MFERIKCGFRDLRSELGLPARLYRGENARVSPVRVRGRRLHDPLAFAGRVEMVCFESELLRGNPLGDPHVRELPVYLPPRLASPTSVAVVFLLSGFTGRGQSYLRTDPWNRGVVAKLDEAMEKRRRAARVALALPDCFTKLGGSQYLNSTAVGAYGDHVTEELVPLVSDELGLDAGRRGVLGKSSGGFGALRLCMTRPGLFRTCGSISGDCGFENTFPGEFLACLRGLVAHDMRPGELPRGASSRRPTSPATGTR